MVENCVSDCEDSERVDLSMEAPPSVGMIFMNCNGDPTDRHECGNMNNGIHGHQPRCRVYRNAVNRIDNKCDHLLHNTPWWSKLFDDRRGIATFTPQSSYRHLRISPSRAEREKASSYARPAHCILNGKLVPGTQVSEYIAISYVWDINSVWKDWCGRCVTEQSLKLSERLSKYTTLPLWIDAACIPQDDKPAKMAELAKMADIYRGATVVLCLVPEVSIDACVTLARCNALMDDECYSELQKATDIYGSYMFATLGEHSSLGDVFASRWWERAWTFQEAVLNPRTYLVGDEEESIPIQHVLRIADPVRHRAASVGSKLTLGKSASFWDSVSTMVDASMSDLPVGDALSCVWRRNATVEHDMVYSLLGVCDLSEQVQPDYDIPFSAVLIQVFESASRRGDHSWIFWCREISRDEVEDGLCMVPTPGEVRTIPFMSITKWRSIPFVPLNLAVQPGAEKGILLPYMSTGIVEWESAPQTLPEMVKILATRGYNEAEIWDLIFGMRVGLYVDIDLKLRGSHSEPADISFALLRLTLAMVDGSTRISQDILDLRGIYAHSSYYGFTTFAAMAAHTWKGWLLTAMSSQGGTVVVPKNKNSGTNPARICILPIEYVGQKASPCGTYASPRVAFVYHGGKHAGNTRFRASAMGIMIQNKHCGLGTWQYRRIG